MGGIVEFEVLDDLICLQRTSKRDQRPGYEKRSQGRDRAMFAGTQETAAAKLLFEQKSKTARMPPKNYCGGTAGGRKWSRLHRDPQAVARHEKLDTQ